MSRKKLLFIVHSLRRAGAQTQLVDLVNNLSNERYEKHLFTIEPQMDLLDRLDQDNVRLYNKQRRFKYDLLSVAREIARVIDEQEIDLVHCTLQFPMLLGWIGTKMATRIPRFVTVVHTTHNRSTKTELQDRLLYQHLLRRCDRVFFVCEKQRDVWLRKYPRLKANSVVVHNGIDADFFAVQNSPKTLQPQRQDLAIADDDDVLCCIARFRPEKGHKHLLDAVAGLEPSPHLLLAGDGELQAEIENHADTLGIRERVHFLGSLPDVRGVLMASDLSVLASTAVETFSMTMLESMSMGVPVVATDIGGMSEAIVPGETGDLVPPGDADALREALARLLDDKEKLAVIGQRCRELVLERFTTDKMVSATDAVIDAVLSGREDTADTSNYINRASHGTEQ